MEFDFGLGIYVTFIAQLMLLAILWCVFRAHKANQRRRHGVYYRILSLWMYFSFYIWLINLAICETSSECHHYLRYLAFSMLGISYIAVLVESRISWELNHLKNLPQDETAWDCIQKQQLIPPKIHMSIECYHYDTPTWSEKIVTFEEGEEFLYGSWVDVSERGTQEARSAVVAQVTIDPSIQFGDQETFDEYKRVAVAMVERGLQRDIFVDFSQSIEIPGLKDTFLGFVDLRMKPFWMSPLFFWVAALLQMTWPYRWLFRAKKGKINYTLKKKIYKSITVPFEGAEGLLTAATADLTVVDASWTVYSTALGHSTFPWQLSGMSSPVVAPSPQASPSGRSYPTGTQISPSPMSYGPGAAVPVSGTNVPNTTTSYVPLRPLNPTGAYLPTTTA